MKRINSRHSVKHLYSTVAEHELYKRKRLEQVCQFIVKQHYKPESGVRSYAPHVHTVILKMVGLDPSCNKYRAVVHRILSKLVPMRFPRSYAYYIDLHFCVTTDRPERRFARRKRHA